MELLFHNLGPTEPPEQGLFFIEDAEFLDESLRANLASDFPTAAGMAFLVEGSGILATASHVPLRCKRRPGQRVNVFGATKTLAIELLAEVLEDGWLGPVTPEGMVLPLSPYWNNAVDERPDIFRQDVCFLRLLPETARWHVRDTGALPSGAASDALIERARVLPLGIATPRSRGDALKCWVVMWESGAPACHAATATLDGVEPGLFDALRFTSTNVGYGFSGSPVWHERRRVVVGVHRRSVLKLPDTRIATGTQALVRPRADLSIALDRRLAPLLNRPLADANAGAAQRHPEFANWSNPLCLAEQQLSGSEPDAPDDVDPDGAPERQSAFAHLVALLSGEPRRQILLHGAPGAGKSTLLRRVATALAEHTRAGAAFPLVPVLVSARELADCGMDLRRVLNTQLARLSPVEAEPVDVLDCVEETGARLVLLVDGLDEVDRSAGAQILGSLLWTARSESRLRALEPRLIHHVLVASRPTDETRRPLGPDRPGLLRYQLNLLGVDATRELALALVGDKLDDEARVLFETGLKNLRLMSPDTGATPLQVWMAAVVFKHAGQLPPRPLDLVHQFVALVTSGVSARIVQRGERISKARLKVYDDALNEILAFVAHLSVGQGSQALSEALLRERLEDAAARNTPAAWMADPDDLLIFLFEHLPAAVGVLSVAQDSEGQAQLVWTHATFADYLCACHILNTHPAAPAERANRFSERLRQGSHWPALALLSEMERREEFDAVAKSIDFCLNAPASTTEPRLFAFRALAIGIDAGGQSRRQQVKALVRFYVSGAREAGSCARLFLLEDLPHPEGILGRIDLRDDVYVALHERFAPRLRLARLGRHVRVFAREAEVIRMASLESEMEALGLPSSPAPTMTPQRARVPRADVDASSEVVGSTQLIIHQPDGRLVSLELPALRFAEGLVLTARANPDVRSTAQIVAMTSRWFIDQSRGT